MSHDIISPPLRRFDSPIFFCHNTITKAHIDRDGDESPLHRRPRVPSRSRRGGDFLDSIGHALGIQSFV